MKKIIFQIIILCTLMTGILYAQNAQVSPVAGLNQQNTSVVNNNFQNVQAGVNGIFGLLSQYFTAGVLNTTAGGTGQNSSNWQTGDVIAMSSVGRWANIGVGTTSPSQFLETQGAGALPIWATPVSPKIIYFNQIDLETHVATSDQTVTRIIDASGDWASKSFMFVGDTAGNSPASTGLGATHCWGLTDSGNNIVSTTSSNPFNGTFSSGASCTTAPATSWGSFSLLTWGSYSGAIRGAGNCTISISGGNLIESATMTWDTSLINQKTSCEISGMIIRMP